MADEIKKTWIIKKGEKLYPSTECGYWQKSEDYCHHKEVREKCIKKNCPFLPNNS